MMFLALACLLTALAVLAVAAPLWRVPPAGADSLGYDREIYRARLTEIDSDLALGRLGPQEADSARAEEGRKLLAVSSRTGPAPPAHANRALLLAAILFVPFAAGLFYWDQGQPHLPDMALATRPDRDLSQQSLEQLLERAEARLAEEPGDLRGWRVVAPVYLRLGRVEDAVTAYRNALRLSPDDTELKTALAEAMVVAARGVVTDDAHDLFEQALAASPGAAKPRFYLAIALGQQGDWPQAADAWQALIAEAPSNAPWLDIARAGLAEALANTDGAAAGASDEAGTPSGPTAADIEAASELSGEERRTMIEGMVAGLATRLAENPDDKPGWLRLIRSYTVMGAGEEARSAIARARSHFAGDDVFLAELDNLERSLGKGQETQ